MRALGKSKACAEAGCFCGKAPGSSLGRARELGGTRPQGITRAGRMVAVRSGEAQVRRPPASWAGGRLHEGAVAPASTRPSPRELPALPLQPSPGARRSGSSSSVPGARRAGAPHGAQSQRVCGRVRLRTAPRGDTPGPPAPSSPGQSPRWFHSQVLWGLLFLALSPEWGA